MKVLFDHHIFSWQKYGGVSKYFVELIQCLRNQEVECVLPFLITKNYHLKSINNKALHVKDVKGTYHLIEFFNKINSMYLLRKKDYDLFHPTSTDEYILPHLANKPFVVTAHDLTIELFPEYFNIPNFVQNTIKERKAIYKKASRIIAISNNTKNDLVNFYQIDPEKIDVIYHGYSPPTDDSECKSDFPFLNQKFLLYVGSRKEYKNFPNFLTASSSFIKENIQIVCVGGGPFTSEEKELIKLLKIEDSIFQFDVNNSELDFLYSQALLFIYPSLYEGFGMPILEAFANNCPVALSNIEVFSEIAGSAAEYFDPRSTESIQNTISQIINTEGQLEKMKKRGSDLLKEFSWEKTASQTMGTYQKALACS